MESKQHVAFEIRNLTILMKRKMDDKLGGNGYKKPKFTQMHGWAMDYLYNNRDREVYQKDFEKSFGIRRSTASNILRLMEKRGIITRETAEYDTRLKKITLTPEAIRHHDIVTSHMEEFEKELIKGIPPEKLEVFFDVIESIKQNLGDSNNIPI